MQSVVSENVISQNEISKNVIPQNIPHTNFQKYAILTSKCGLILLAFLIPISTTYTYLALFVTILGWICAGELKSHFQYIAQHPLTKVTFGLFAAYLIGATYSVASSDEVIRSLNQMGKLIYLPFLLPIFKDERRRLYPLYAFLIAMGLTVFLAFLKMYAEFPIIPEYWVRYSRASVFKNHIDTNLMMAFAAYCVSYFALKQTRILTSLLLWCVFAFMSFYIFAMSEGRAGQIIFILLAFLLAYKKLKTKGILIATLLLTVMIGLIGSQSTLLQIRWQQIQDSFRWYQQDNNYNTSLGQRILYTQETFALAKQHPWFGWGTGSFKEVYGKHAKEHQLQMTTNPHNEYLNIFLQLGFFGLIALSRFYWVLFRKSFELPPLESTLSQGLLLAFVVGSFANSWLMDFTSGYFFIFIAALCYSTLSNEYKKAKN